MNKVYFTISSGTTMQLKECDKTGTLTGSNVVTGVSLGSNKWSFDIAVSSFYTLYIDSVAQTEASILRLEGGDMAFLNVGGVPTAQTNISMNSHKIASLTSGTDDGDAVNFGQVKNSIDATQFPGTLPAMTVTNTGLTFSIMLSINDYSGIPANSSVIFFYAVKNSASDQSFAVDSKGVVTLSGSVVVQATSNTPTIVLPKSVPFIADYYIHAGYVLMNFGGVTAIKKATPVQIAHTYVDVSTRFAEPVDPGDSESPILTDNGNNIGIIIPPAYNSTHIGDFEFAYGFLETGSAHPTISSGNVITGLTTYSIQMSTSRGLSIQKPLLDTDSYEIWVTYRYVTLAGQSKWHKAVTSNELTGLQLIKRPLAWSAEEIEALVDQMCSKLMTDSSYNVIRK